MARWVGIDLGTSTSEIACIEHGKVRVLPNDLGKLVTPSVVHIQPDGSPLVGEAAQKYLFTQPENTFIEIKRLMGSGKQLRAWDKEYTPEELQSYILRYLLDCAEKVLGESVESAVITVPAYFTDAQRRGTARAGELAGVKVERILNEPTAAALDYGLSNLKQCKNILIYDFGGGTLDVTVLELFEGVIDVMASGGNNHLGGKEFDSAIMNQLSQEFFTAHTRRIEDDPRANMRLKQAAEDCKIALSTSTEYTVELPFLLPGKKGTPLSIERVVTRDTLESWIGPIADQTRFPLLSTLADAKLAPGELDLVLLVGGSTKIPYVSALVERCLSLAPQALVDPDLAVVRGAAIQAGMLQGIFAEDQEIILTDVCPYTLGIEVHNLYTDTDYFDPLIQRNTTIPTSITRPYVTGGHYQTQVKIRAYQGESTNLEHDEFLGEVQLAGIPPRPMGKEAVLVTFGYDMNGILQVTATVKSTGKSAETTISMGNIEPKELIDREKWAESTLAKKFRSLIRKAERELDALEKSREEEENYFAAMEIQRLLDSLKEALVLEDEAEAESLREELLDLFED